MSTNEAHGNARPFRVTYKPEAGAAETVERLGLQRACAAALEGRPELEGMDAPKRAASRARVALAYSPVASFNIRARSGRIMGALHVERLDDSDAARLRAEEQSRLEAERALDGRTWGDERKRVYRARLRIFDERAGSDGAQSEALNESGGYASEESEAAHLLEAFGLLDLLQAAANKAGAIHAARDRFAPWPGPPHCFTFEELARRVPHIRSQISRTPNGTSVVFPMRGELYGREGEEPRYRAYLDFGPHIEELFETRDAPSIRAGFKRRPGIEAE